jgi:hypothetical protein
MMKGGQIFLRNRKIQLGGYENLGNWLAKLKTV